MIQRLDIVKMPEYKLTYFDFKGLGESVRFMLSYGGLEFEDIRINYKKSWAAIKPTTPIGQVPVLEINGKEYHHTLPICRYLAKQSNIGGETDLEDLELAAIANSMQVFGLCMHARLIQETNAVRKAKKREEIVNMTHHFDMERFEDRVKNNGGYFYGEKLTYVDLFFTAVQQNMNGLMGFDVIRDYSNLRNLTDKV